jgi:hypothetical protein|nr:MAG TPA: hypothetical protein [Caudoviricetes sp.]
MQKYHSLSFVIFFIFFIFITLSLKQFYYD